MIKRLSISLILLLRITNCQSNQLNTTQLISKTANSSKMIIGIVQFPKIGFKVKADISDISQEATVSIIYPSDHLTNANKIISTGLSTSNGSFLINSSPNFHPGLNEVFVLEATKRIKGIGNNSMSIRTFIRWSGSVWQSITTDGIYINSYTNALAIIANYNKDVISSNDTIGKIGAELNGDPVISDIGAELNGDPVISDIGTEPNILVTSDKINQVKDLINQALIENKDPFSAIIFDGYNYYLNRDIEIGQLKQTNACVSCSFVGQSLPDILAEADLSNADLSEQYLTDYNLTNTNLAGADLSGSVLSDIDLTVVNNKNLSNSYFNNTLMDGVNLSGTATVSGVNLSNSELTNSDLSYADLKYSNLTGAKFNNADLSYADLNNATISPTTDFSGANMSYTTWIDGTVFDSNKICGVNSIGQCN